MSLQQNGSDFINDCFLKAVSSDGNTSLFQSRDQDDLQLYQRNLKTSLPFKVKPKDLEIKMDLLDLNNQELEFHPKSE